MFEAIIDCVCRYSSRKIKISNGALILITIGSFILGVLTGTAVAKLTSKKKGRCSSDFDADEYVRTLNFDDDEE